MNGNNEYVTKKKLCIESGNIVLSFALLIFITSLIASFAPSLFGLRHQYATYIVYLTTAFICFEGVTNIRITSYIVDKFFPAKTACITQTAYKAKEFSKSGYISVERAWRIIVAMMLWMSAFFEPLWFMAWYLVIMLFFTGLCEICIMSMFLVYIGLTYDESNYN